MLANPDVAILANCTHLALAETLRRSELFGRVDSFELFSLPEAERAPLASRLGGYDLILGLEHGRRFGPLATEAVRDRYGDRLVILPTPFFPGWQPDMAYLTDRGRIASAEALLGDYHSGLLLAELKEGLDDEAIIRRYVSGEAFDRMDLEGLWDRGLAELREREARTDLGIADWIEAHRDAPQPFLSFNHPREEVIAHIATDFAARVLGGTPKIPPLPPAELNLYRDAFWPVHPEVARRLGLAPAQDARFKAPDRLGGARLAIADFARGNLNFFRRIGLDQLNVVTPGYLPAHIGPRPATSPPKARVDLRPPEIVLTHFGRSGSTVLARLLAQHSKIAWLDEIFSLIWIRTPEAYDLTPGRMQQIVAEARARALKAKPGAIVGHEIKLMNFLQNPSANMIDYVARLTDPARHAHVVLRRRNVLRRIFSVYKAMTTKVYHVQAGAPDHAARQYRVDMKNLFDPDTGQRAATLPELLDKALAREEAVLDNYRKLGLRYFTLTYEEDIEADPLQGYRKVLGHLRLPEEPAEVTLAKTSGLLAAEVQNWDAVRQALLGTRHEWMLGEGASETGVSGAAQSAR